MNENSAKKTKRVMPCRKLIGLTVRGLVEPENYAVSEDVFRIVQKLLALNQLAGPYTGVPLVEFDEVRFLVQLLGVLISPVNRESDLWIADD